MKSTVPEVENDTDSPLLAEEEAGPEAVVGNEGIITVSAVVLSGIVDPMSVGAIVERSLRVTIVVVGFCVDDTSMLVVRGAWVELSDFTFVFVDMSTVVSVPDVKSCVWDVETGKVSTLLTEVVVVADGVLGNE